MNSSEYVHISQSLQTKHSENSEKFCDHGNAYMQDVMKKQKQYPERGPGENKKG